MNGALVWKIAHCRTGGRRGKHSMLTYTFVSLIFGDLVITESSLNMDEFFLGLLPRNFYSCTQTMSRELNRATMNRRGNGMFSLCPSCGRSTFARVCRERRLTDPTVRRKS